MSSVTIPNSVTTIYSNPFAGCSNIEAFIIQSGNDYYTVDDGVLFTKDKKSIIAYPSAKQGSTYIIPNTVETIGNGAFYTCYKLTSVVFPNSLNNIGMHAFYHCNNLKSISLLEGVNTISSYAFSQCTGLTHVTIPSSVTSIGDYAFVDCNQLQEVHSMITHPFSINDKVFLYYDYDNGISHFSSATLYVPYGCKAAYQQALGWKNFQTIVEMEPEGPVKGDLDGNGYTDVTDLVAGIDFILGTRELNETEQYILDMNNDGEVNVGDIILLIKAILNTQGHLTPAMARGQQASFDLSEYTALQMTVTVPMGSEVTGMRLTGNNQRTHQLMYQQTGENTYAVVVYSMQNQTFSPVTDGFIVVEGVNEAQTSNVLLSTKDCERYWLDSLPYGMLTGIAAVHDGMTNEQPVYDLSGRRVANDASAKRKWSKGIYIVDGQKVVIK